MMTLIFTVFDTAAGMYLEPFCAPSVDYALRTFKAMANREGHQFHAYPGDYTLFHIGEFSPESGTIEGMSPRSLGVAIQFVEPAAQGDQIPMELKREVNDGA